MSVVHICKTALCVLVYSPHLYTCLPHICMLLGYSRKVDKLREGLEENRKQAEDLCEELRYHNNSWN